MFFSLKNINWHVNWMIGDHVLRSILTIILFGYIAQKIGPDSFGILNFCFSLISLGLPFCKLGLDSILIREFSDHKKNISVILVSAFCMLALSGLIAFVLLNLLVKIFLNDSPTIQFLIVLSVGYLFHNFLVIDFYFQSIKKAEFSSISKVVAFFTSALLKVFVLNSDVPLVWLFFVFSIDGLILGFVLCLFFLKSARKFNIFDRRNFSLNVCRSLLKSSHPMIASGIAGILLIKTDQLMIASFMSYKDVGLYSAGSRLYEGWMSLIYVLSVALLPVMVTNKKNFTEDQFVEKTSELFSLGLFLSLLFAVGTSMFGYFGLELLYGEAYLDSFRSLVILSWSAIFASMGYLSSRFLIVEKFESKISRRNWYALLINLALNYLLIPKVGMLGASISTFISVFLAHYFFDYFDSDLAVLVKIKNRAMLRVIGK